MGCKCKCNGIGCCSPKKPSSGPKKHERQTGAASPKGTRRCCCAQKRLGSVAAEKHEAGGSISNEVEALKLRREAGDDEYNITPRKSLSEIPPRKTDEGENARDDRSVARNKQAFPLAAVVILIHISFSMLAWYGLRAILQLYFIRERGIDEHISDSIIHGHLALFYITTILAGNIADNYVGRYWAIVIGGFIYAVGYALVGVSDLPWMISMASTLGLGGVVIIAIGQGFMKGTIAAFGAEQFVLPDQDKHMTRYFTMLYFAVNGCSFMAFTLAPFARDHPCLGQSTCYTLPFAVAALCAILTPVSFLLGSPSYKRPPPAGNKFFKFVACVYAGLKNRYMKKQPGQKYTHWLDYAEISGFDADFIRDSKGVVSVLPLTIPVPFYWALYDMSASKWIRMALRMDGYISDSIYIAPDSLQWANPVMFLVLLPLFTMVVYPFCHSMKVLSTHVQKMSAGLIVMSFAFLLASVLEYLVSKGETVAPSDNETGLRLISFLAFPMSIVLTGAPKPISTILGANGGVAMFDALPSGISYTIRKENATGSEIGTFSGAGGQVFAAFLTGSLESMRFVVAAEPEEAIHGKDRFIARVTHSLGREMRHVVLRRGSTIDHDFGTMTGDGFSRYSLRLKPRTYQVEIDGVLVGESRFRAGGIYNILVMVSSNGAGSTDDRLTVAATTEPNRDHILWQLLMYLLVAISEVLFSPVGVEFYFRETPPSMRSAMTGVWYALSALGNIVVVIVSAANPFPTLWLEFLFYTACMSIATIVFLLIARKYVYRADEVEAEGGPAQEQILGEDTRTSHQSTRRTRETGSLAVSWQS